MYTAKSVNPDQTEYRFRKLTALVKRLGGDGFMVEHGTRTSVSVILQVTRTSKVPGDNARHGLDVLRVPIESLPSDEDNEFFRYHD